MYYIRQTPSHSDGYPAPQSSPAPGLLALPEKFLPMFLENNGFVTLTIEDSAVTGMEPNLEAWEAWKTSLPEPTPAPPTALEQLRADMDFIAIMTGVEL